jgi:hypothetical protein
LSPALDQPSLGSSLINSATPRASPSCRGKGRAGRGPLLGGEGQCIALGAKHRLSAGTRDIWSKLLSFKQFSETPQKLRRGALSAQEARSASRATQIEIDVCSSNFPRRARNTNSGNPVMSRDRETNIRVAEKKIHRGPATPLSCRCLAVSKSTPRSQVSPAYDVLGCCHPSAAGGALRRSGILQVLFGRMLKTAMRLRGYEIQADQFCPRSEFRTLACVEQLDRSGRSALLVGGRLPPRRRSLTFPQKSGHRVMLFSGLPALG